MSSVFTLHVSLENDAFHPEYTDELARILHDVSVRLRLGEVPTLILRDVNGNKVGQAQIINT